MFSECRMHRAAGTRWHSVNNRPPEGVKHPKPSIRIAIHYYLVCDGTIAHCINPLSMKAALTPRSLFSSSLRNALAVIALSAAVTASAQPGALDTSFDPGTGANGSVYTTALQPDGKIIIGGFFSSYNGTPRSGIARLNVDGSLDASFDPGTGADNDVAVVTTALQPDGKVIIGGYFTTFNGAARNHIARLNADGSLDSSFDPGAGADSPVVITALQPDGKIIIGGQFISYNGTDVWFLARLNADGGLDATFDTGYGVGSGALDPVLAIAVQPDGKIIVGGDFTAYYDLAPRNNIVRVNTDGSVDTSFDPGAGTDGPVASAALQPDGEILIGGQFGHYNGTLRHNIARILADGSLDASFDPGNGANDDVLSSALQPDGKIIIGGAFMYYNATRHRIARIDADGSLDASFDPGTGADNVVYTTTLQPDGRIIIGGWFTTYNGTTRNHIARVMGEEVTTSTGTGTLAASEMHLWPNPNDGRQLWFSMPAVPEATKATVEILDMMGQRVMAREVAFGRGQPRTPLDLGELAAGTYSLGIAAGDVRTTRQLVVRP